MTRSNVVEFRTEHRRKKVVMERLELPRRRDAGSALIVVLCAAGAVATIFLGYALTY